MTIPTLINALVWWLATLMMLSSRPFDYQSLFLVGATVCMFLLAVREIERYTIKITR
jgi:hypothetical protein